MGGSHQHPGRQASRLSEKARVCKARGCRFSSPVCVYNSRMHSRHVTPDHVVADSQSQTIKAQLRLRALILSGQLQGGARIAELALVDLLGMSRTPIRAALVRLEQEGLLVSVPNGGFAIKTFSEKEVSDAIELRGCLEGLMARMAAERGVSAEHLGLASDCLEAIDGLLDQPSLDDSAFTRYVALNARFHGGLLEMAASEVIRKEAERATALPFASPSAFVLSGGDSSQARDMLIIAQHQHRQVLQAISLREGSRAESLMREHSRLAQRNLKAVIAAGGQVRVPGLQLIRRGN